MPTERTVPSRRTTSATGQGTATTFGHGSGYDLHQYAPQVDPLTDTDVVIHLAALQDDAPEEGQDRLGRISVIAETTIAISSCFVRASIVET